MSRPVRAAITGLGVFVPEKVLSNSDFEKFLDTSDEWITQRTGIKERHVVSDGQTTATMATEAARRALADAGVKASQLDLIICATITPDMTCPATACFIQKNLGAKDVAAFDLAAACSGFLYGIAIASKFIETGMYSRVLVVGAEAW